MIEYTRMDSWHALTLITSVDTLDAVLGAQSINRHPMAQSSALMSLFLIL